jgi:phosphohistidine phosphatase
VRLEAELYGAPAEKLRERLRAVPEAVTSVMLIGHNPGLQDLALALASAGAERERVREKLPTAAFATLILPKTTWSRLSEADAVLAAYVVPKQLG